ncbi:MAG: hypothetical protein QM576_13125 [Rhodopseudomonas sp.]|uniref:hypothetical protein n=1 Tax=Rhodopseudomonas sp. TaxID=1078 RepID=UPI0039E556AF
MAKIITASEFVIGILCALKIAGVDCLRLSGHSTDSEFESAYEDLLSTLNLFDVRPDFSLATDPFHGDSETLRETLYAARQKGIVAINNPSFKTVEIKLEEPEIDEILDRSPLPRDYLMKIANKHFCNKEERHGEQPRSASASIAG